jgi:hypothetical protein
MQNPAEGQGPQGPDKRAVIQMVRRAVGPKLDSLSQATDEAKEATRLLELAEWAGDHEAEEAIRQALGTLATAAHPRA